MPPPRKVWTTSIGKPRRYGKDAAILKSRRQAGDETLEKPLPRSMFEEIATIYVDP